jgi:hypothetical protein
MSQSTVVRFFVSVGCLLAASNLSAADVPKITFTKSADQLTVAVGGKPLATYVFRDAKIARPYFAHLKASGGTQITRNHPPIPGQDATDHASYHPGLWLAFGDISGHDYWRLKAKVVHDGFVAEPKGAAGRGSFAVRNKYLTTDGRQTVCSETCRFTFLVRPTGYLILWDSTFTSDDADFYFGDQEEMGLGVRVATPISVRGVSGKGGGQITNAAGDKNERGTWGKQSAWCDYSGTVGGRRVGITLMPHPNNFRSCWFHARDYGFVAANPFGRNAFTRAEKSKIVVKQGQSLRLRWGVLLHSEKNAEKHDARGAYLDALKQFQSDAR